MQAALETTWWLEVSAPEQWHWSRLQIFRDGKAKILDCDGNYHTFSTKRDAELWLREDEYSRYEHFIEDGEIAPTVTPPLAHNEDELVELIKFLAKFNPPGSR
jgi:hypothetical protein